MRSEQLTKKLASLIESRKRRLNEKPRGFDLKSVSPEDRERVQSLRQQDHIFVVRRLLTYGLSDFITLESSLNMVDNAQPDDLPILRDSMWEMVGEDARRKLDLIEKLTSFAHNGMWESSPFRGHGELPYRWPGEVGQDDFDYKATIYWEALTFLLPPQRKDNKRV